jgi:glycosyltransferase involved in cell wall biosynthesis
MKNPSKKPEPLQRIDIVMSIYNQEHIIEAIMSGIFAHTVTPFNLILIFDGCTDRTKERCLTYIERHKPAHLLSVITADTPNIFETRANNVGFRLARERYMITLQDDMLIKEKGWDVRLTYPLRAFDDVLAVTGRIAQNIKHMDAHVQTYTKRAGRELMTLPRSRFAVREIINRGPIAFRTDYLKELGYLNEAYAPSVFDEADLSLRAWEQHRWKVGAFWIDYESDPSWSKALAADSGMKSSTSTERNAPRLAKDHEEYFKNRSNRYENIRIPSRLIDYPAGCNRRKLAWTVCASQWAYRWRVYPKRIKRIATESLRSFARTLLGRNGRNRHRDEGIA